MIAFLEGTVEEKNPTCIVLNVAGVGYEVFIPLSSYDRIAEKGRTCRVLTYDHVREDQHVLFGFTTEEERRMFTLLLTISGVGPKIALSALSGMSVRQIKAALVEQDVKRLSSISGVGKKTAERMIVELRDKIGAADALEAVAGPAEDTPEGLRARDAMLALISLGYKQNEADKMIRAVLKDGVGGMTVEEMIRKALAR